MSVELRFTLAAAVGVQPAFETSKTDAFVTEKPKGAAVKLTPDGLIGTWLEKVNGERLPLSFHRPPVEKDVQLDNYQGEATISTLARFTIGEAGLSAVVVLEHPDGATYGALRPAENGSLWLMLICDELRVPDAGIVLTRDADGTSTKPRQERKNRI